MVNAKAYRFKKILRTRTQISAHIFIAEITVMKILGLDACAVTSMNRAYA
jgi:hypothetical protein